MKFKTNITAEYLRSRVHYDPDIGEFIWLPKTTPKSVAWNTMRAGKKAGYASQDGYYNLCIDNIKYRAHRLAYLYMTGEHPPEYIDHRDTDKSNNRWNNIRCASVSDNGCNTNRRADNTSGHKGIYWHKRAQKWMVAITRHGTDHYLGLFDDINDAITVHRKAAEELHNEFVRVDDVDFAKIGVPRKRTTPDRFNRPKQVNNKSGYKGVSWDRRSQKWLVQIVYKGKKWLCRLFDDIEDAAAAYQTAYAELHGDLNI